MATNFPSSLDTFTNPSSTDAMDSVSVPHATQHSDLNDAVEALEAKVGANSSAVSSSHDYKIAQLESDVAGLVTGKIVQVVSAQTNTAFSTTSTSYVDVTGLSVSITPTSASNTILLMFAANASANTSNILTSFQLDRNGTAIPGGGTYDSIINTQFNDSSIYETHNVTVNYVDSPATTSALTYKVQMKVSSGTVYVFRRQDSSTVTSYGSLIALEVSS